MRSMLVLVALATCFASLAAFAGTRDREDYGVFCVRGRLSLEQRRIEELKASVGHDVCRLDQDQSEAAAREKILRLGGIGARCSCE